MKHSVKIQTKNPAAIEPEIMMEWQNQARKGKGAYGECVISEGGVYKILPYIPSGKIEEQKKDRQKIVKISLPLVTSLTQHSKLWSREFSYYDTTQEAEKNGLTEVDNNNTKLIVNALKRHAAVSFQDDSGKELNENVNSILVKYSLVDVTEKIVKDAEKASFTIEATSQIHKWYKEDNQQLVTFAYLWGLKGIKSEMTTQEIQSLYVSLVREVSSDLEKYNNTTKFISSDIHINVIKGTRIDKNGSKIIYQEGNYFMYNGEVVAEGETIEGCIEVAVAYFSVNHQQYTLLKNDLGIKDELPRVSVKETEKPQEGELKSLASLNKNPHEKKQADKLKAKFANLIYRIVVDGKDITAEKQGTAYKTLEATGKTVDECLVELSNFAEIKDDTAFQEFFQTEANRVKKERTPYEY